MKTLAIALQAATLLAVAATDVRELLQSGVDSSHREKSIANYRFASGSGGQASIVAVLLNFWRKCGRITLQNVPCSSHSFLRVGNVIVAVIALALP